MIKETRKHLDEDEWVFMSSDLKKARNDLKKSLISFFEFNYEHFEPKDNKKSKTQIIENIAKDVARKIENVNFFDYD